MEILTLDQQTEKAKEAFYKDKNREIYTPSELERYETAFCYGWLQSSYIQISNELKELKAKYEK